LVGAAIAESYRNALTLYGSGRVTEAREAFQRAFDADPGGELADNALFWLGETYFSAGAFVDAMRYYRRVTDQYGDQNKAPDAMYKLAIAYEKTGDLALAKKTLQEVIARYPYSAPAASARQELERIQY
jgi:tol-pal system protein YbgF